MRGFWRTLYRYPRLQLGVLLAAPLGWLVVAYLGSLALLFISAFWTIEPFSGKVVTAAVARQLRDVLLTNPSTGRSRCERWACARSSR